LKQVWESGRSTELSPGYSWHGVARQLQAIYGRAMNGR
jgi:hypothetical protein